MIKRHIHIIFAKISLLALHLLLPAQSYRVGDAVGIIIRTNKHKIEAYRHQMPRFGVSTKTKIDTQFLLGAGDDLKLVDDVRLARQQPIVSLQEELILLSMSFDEGFHHTSLIDVYNPSQRPPRKALDTLVITFVYSASDGSIHSVQQDVRYRDLQQKGGRYTMPKSFTVEYVWIEEADVDLEGGAFVLFAVVLIVAIFGMVDICCGSGSEESESGRYLPARRASDGFAKRL